jgi:hypothetical protein
VSHLFREVPRSIRLVDDRGRERCFPGRQDYISHLQRVGLIDSETTFNRNDKLVETVYLDWLTRGQVGCIFAQLLGRPRSRRKLRIVVFSTNAASFEDTAETARLVSDAVSHAVRAKEIEALTILLPAITSIDNLARFVVTLGNLPGWRFESLLPWRSLVRVGLRAHIEGDAWAEILGTGPFPQFFPATRQSPITSLEIRTKTRRGVFSKVWPRKYIALHAAQIPAEDFIGGRSFSRLFDDLTPKLRLRMLGGESDERAKAAVTFAIPTAVWQVANRSRQPITAG